MSTLRILIVDDEKNTGSTLSQALQPLAYEVETAVNGDDALRRLDEKEFSLLLLDLNPPGHSSLDILRWVTRCHPEVRVILISTPGAIGEAVEAMKLGAIDVWQKPFAPQELRQVVSEILDRNKAEAAQSSAYEYRVRLIRQSISDHHFESARAHARQAIGLDPSRPEAFNLLGVLYELGGNHEEAMKQYRVAVDLDPTYRLAWQNLTRPAESGKNRIKLDLRF
jgi:DNA-binding NtrC family response regulator